MSKGRVQPADSQQRIGSDNDQAPVEKIARKATENCAAIESATASFYEVSDTFLIEVGNLADKAQYNALQAAKLRTENTLLGLWPLEIEGVQVAILHPESVRVEQTRSKTLREIDQTFNVLGNLFRGYIEKSPTVTSIDEALSVLNGYIARHPGQSISKAMLLSLFPQLGASDAVKLSSDQVVLPLEAPEKYQGLRGPETPPVFVQRVYGEWLGHGLTRAHIRQLDPTLYQAIVNWTRKPENEWPADVDLPTLKEQNTRWADRVGKDGIMSAVDGLSGQEAVREARRLANLRHRRSKEQQQR